MNCESLKAAVKRFLILVLFVVALAYIEAAVVVYLRVIFYPQGFVFPIADFAADPKWTELLLTEIAREAATLIIIFTGAWLIGRNLPQRIAYWLTIFAIWDIFYYVWLKVLLNWPVSIMDWDILFLIPIVWASPVLAPVITSLTMLCFAIVILYRDHHSKPLRIAPLLYVGFVLASLNVVGSFCIAGLYVTKNDYQSHFSWPVFLTSHILAVILFLLCCRDADSNKAVCAEKA